MTSTLDHPRSLTTPNLDDPESRRPRISTTPKLDDLKTELPQNSRTPKLNDHKLWWLKLDDPKTRRPRNSTTPKLECQTRRPQNSTNPKLDESKTQQPRNSTTPKLNDPKTQRPQNSTTPKLNDPPKKGQGRARDDFYNFFVEQRLILVVIFFMVNKIWPFHKHSSIYSWIILFASCPHLLSIRELFLRTSRLR